MESLLRAGKAKEQTQCGYRGEKSYNKSTVEAVEKGMLSSPRPPAPSEWVASVRRYVAAAKAGRSLVPKKRPGGSKLRKDATARRLLEADLHARPQLHRADLRGADRGGGLGE